jgi:hypothetical protein
MAKTVQIVDDIDGSPHAETVEFSLDSNRWSIDLSKKNRAALEKALKPFIDAAHKTGGRGVRRAASPRRGRGTPAQAPDLAAIREWAGANGFSVAPRGRIAGEVVEAYHAAH